MKLFGKLESILQKCVIIALKVFVQNNENLILELIYVPVIASFILQHQVKHTVKKYDHL